MTISEKNLYILQRELPLMDEEQLNSIVKFMHKLQREKSAKEKAVHYMQNRDITLTVKENGQITKKVYVREKRPRISPEKKQIITDPFIQAFMQRASS